jgi:hypothetical protein
MHEDEIDSKINNDKIIDEDNMASDSATKVPTQQSVKAYVDASTGGHVIEDEGTPLTQRTKLNFVGGGVAVTDDSGDDASVVTIPLQGVRSVAVASTATLTPDLDNYDSFTVTAQAAGLTIANPTGTLQDMREFTIRIKDNGTPRVISYGTQYRQMEISLPVLTITSKYLFLQCSVNTVDTKMDVVAVVNEI